MPFTIIRQDITTLSVDAIVNAANTALRMGGGVCGAIFNAAGTEQLQAACNDLAPIRTGESVITPGFALPAKFIIHTAGPIYREEIEELCEKQLSSAYLNSLKTAVENNCNSIAFPLISSGIYGYPKKKAFQIASSTISRFLVDHDLDVNLVLFDKKALPLRRDLRREIDLYIDEHLNDMKFYSTGDLDRRVDIQYEMSEELTTIDKLQMSPMCEDLSLQDCLQSELTFDLDEPFSQLLLRMIDGKEMTDVEVYKRANLDRRLFSKIRGKGDYLPSKRTAIALAIGLKLSLSETNDLLKRAGYSLSNAIAFDVIIEYFISRQRYDIFEINEVLFSYDQPLLGGANTV